MRFSPELPDEDVHVIRLRGPWQYQVLAAEPADGPSTEQVAELPPPGRIHMPADWGASLGADFRGRVRYLRAFGRPSGLDPSHRVFLVIEQVDAAAQCWLNDAALGKCSWDSRLRAEVTELLQPRNRLQVDVSCPRTARRPDRQELPGGLVGEVRLELVSL